MVRGDLALSDPLDAAAIGFLMGVGAWFASETHLAPFQFCAGCRKEAEALRAKARQKCG